MSFAKIHRLITLSCLIAASYTFAQDSAPADTQPVDAKTLKRWEKVLWEGTVEERNEVLSKIESAGSGGAAIFPVLMKVLADSTRYEALAKGMGEAIVPYAVEVTNYDSLRARSIAWDRIEAYAPESYDTVIEAISNSDPQITHAAAETCSRLFAESHRRQSRSRN